MCLEDEKAARDQIVKDWANYPAVAKARCIQTKEYLPGYVEWQACLDMTKDVVNLRKDETGGTAGSTSSDSARSTATGPTRSTATRRGRRTSAVRAGSSKECPFVKYAEDGSIVYITNCPGPEMPGM